MLHCEAMADMLISKQRSSQIVHDLMNLDQDASGLFRVEVNRLNMRIDLAPLLCPVSADFFMTTDKTAFERSRPSHVRSHEGEGGVDVSRVKSSVGCA